MPPISPALLNRPAARIPALDGLRGAAILMVTGYRFRQGPDVESAPARWFFALLEHGDLGVDLFFVLSGFLITGILFDAKPTEHYFRNFYCRRALRIFPLYYACLCLTLVVLPGVWGDADFLFAEAREDQAWLWLYGANLLMGIRDSWCLGSFTHLWSLAVEEQFYLVWPLVIWFGTRQRAMVACACFVVASLLGRAVWLLAGGSVVAAECFAWFRLDALALGGWLALALRGSEDAARCRAWAWPALGCFSLGMVAIATLPDRYFCGANLTIRAGFFASALMIVVAAGSSSWGWLWSSPVLRFFGKYSYAMYVFQLPLIAVMAPFLTADSLAQRAGSALVGRAAYLLSMTLLTTALAVASWHAFEKHFLALKARFEPGAVWPPRRVPARWELEEVR